MNCNCDPLINNGLHYVGCPAKEKPLCPSDAAACSASPSDLLPPREIIEAAATVALWMEKMGYRNWQLGGVCDRRFAAKCPDAEEMRKGLWPIRQAQTMLEDNYPKWNEAGQAHAITSACEYLRDAHNRISHLYAALIGLPNVKADSTANQ
jgi:hypothetical protein